MSKERPKSALANFLATKVQAAQIDAQVRLPVRTPLFEEKNLEANIPNPDHTIVTINPENCSPWEYYDRPEEEFGDIESLANSMKTHGQQEPILVRPASEPNKYEVIFGNRRWRAAKEVGLPLIAIVKSLTDQQAALCQKEENENRKDLSDYARALSYRKLIANGVFASENELSKTLGISRKTLNDIMAYLRVPDSLRNKISNFSEISRLTAVKLSVLSKDPQNLEILESNARKISEKKINSNNIDKFLQEQQQVEIKAEMPQLITLQDNQGRGVVFLKSSPSGNIFINLDKRLTRKLSIDTIKEHMEALLNQIRD